MASLPQAADSVLADPDPVLVNRDGCRVAAYFDCLFVGHRDGSHRQGIPVLPLPPTSSDGSSLTARSLALIRAAAVAHRWLGLLPATSRGGGSHRRVNCAPSA